MSNYKKVSDKIEELLLNNSKLKGNLKWINVVNAGKDEINYLRRSYGFDLAHLRQAASRMISQRPLVLKGNNYLFLVLHFPAMEKGRVVSAEIDFFIGHGFLIMSHNNNLRSLKDMFALSKKSPDSLIAFSLESSAVLLYEIINRLFKNCYDLIDSNSVAISEIEELIFNSRQKEAVGHILTLRRNVVNLRKILQNHKNIMKSLMEMESRIVARSSLKVFYSELVDDSKRIWEMLDNQKEMIDVLNTTNESLLNSQMTSIMKTLTIVSVFIFPLNLIAAIFTLRSDDMPIISHPLSFWIILAIMAICSGLMFLYFSRKKFF